jgi:tRNA nucleotidyltransferase (CCA-adding enzyme)
LFDLERGYVRTTHETSFRDDPLRTLRALRFVAVLGYDLATVTENQMRKYAHAVDGLSLNGTSGTVYDELKKLLMGPQAGRALRIARDTGVLAALLPEIAPMIGFEQGSRYHDMTTDEHTFTALDHAVAAEAPLRVRMSLLFHDSGKPAAAWKGEDGRLHYYANVMIQSRDHEDEGADIWLSVAKRLNVDKGMRKDVETLIRNHMVPVSRPKASKVARARVKFGDEMLRDLYMHRACDLAGKGGSHVNHEHLRSVGKLEDMRAKMYDERVPTNLKDLKVGGKDAALLGLTSRQISDALKQVLDEVVVNFDATRDSREWQIEALTRVAK